jgi:hypothetical protein
MVQLKIGDYKGLGQFVLQHPGVVAQSEINSLLAEAANTQRAGKEAFAQTYVHHAVVLQKCKNYKTEELKSLFQKLATGRETTKDLIADVNKTHKAIIAQCGVPQPGPRIIQGHKESEVVPRPSMDRVNSLPTRSQQRQGRDKDGRLVYIDSQGREIRPAGGRPELQRGRHDSELGPPTGRMAHLEVDEPRDSREIETSIQTKGKRSANQNLKPEQAVDRRTGPTSGGNPQRPKYTIMGTEGDTEFLDGGELAPICCRSRC